MQSVFVTTVHATDCDCHESNVIGISPTLQDAEKFRDLSTPPYENATIVEWGVEEWPGQ